MSNLMIKDLSITEELGRLAMAAVRGGRHHHHPQGNAWGYYAKLGDQPEREYEPSYSDVRVAQAGVGIFNFNDVDFNGGTINITTNGSVTATASA